MQQKMRSSLSVKHAASGVSASAFIQYTPKQPYFESDVFTVTGAGTLSLGEVITPRQIVFKLVSGDDVRVGLDLFPDDNFFLRLSGAGDYMALRMDVEGNVDVSEVVCRADVGGNLLGTYFSIEGTSQPVRVWFATTEVGAPPVGGRSIYVIIETDATALEVQSALIAAMNADHDFTAVAATGTTVKITNVNTGEHLTEITDDGGTGMTVTRTQEGAVMTLPIFESVGTSQVLVCITSV